MASANSAPADDRGARFYVGRAARSVAADGWSVTSSGLVIRGEAGHWARIHVDSRADELGTMLLEGGRAPGLPISLYAGVSSPFLLRVVNHRDADKRPPLGYEHLILLHQVKVRYDVRAEGPPRSLTLPQAFWAETGIVFGPTHAQAWFEAAFRLLLPPLTNLLSDRAILDHLVEHAGKMDHMSFRKAALLAQHIGLDSELPNLVDRAAAASAAFDASIATIGTQT